MLAYIPKNDATSGHGEWLAARGYTVREGFVSKGGFEATEGRACFLVEVNGFITDQVDATNGEALKATLKEAIASQKAFGYNTRFAFNEGTYFRGPALRRLGPASALVMARVKTKEAKEAPKVDSVVGDVLSDL